MSGAGPTPAPAPTSAPTPARAPQSLRRRVARAIVAIVGSLLVLKLVVAFSVFDAKEIGDDVVERWGPAYLASQSLQIAMVNQETGIRGYALSRDETFLDPYERSLGSERRTRAELASFLDGDERLTALLTTYGDAVETWHTEVADPVVDGVRTDSDEAAALISSADAKASFDEVRAATAALSGAIEQQREESARDREQAFVWVWAAIVLGAVLIGLSGFLLWRGLSRTVLRPVESLGEQTRVVAGGDLGRHIVPDGPAELVDLGRDIDTMRAALATQIERIGQARAHLERRTDELARSNEDLEQFAYVASHDLSEPLRKVTNFCQLLERQYGDQLDDRARTYIGFMVDGAKRMQLLINDLLSFSRTGRTTQHFVAVDLDASLRQALSNLEGAIGDAGAEVVSDPLPTLTGDPTLLTALLQNLVGNAVKYRSPDRPPRIALSATTRDGQVHLAVEDNGIGIDRQYAERIFTIFQRLHLRDQYGGTGIGLALCRKIVQFHGGRIWLGEKPTPGARFELTLPLTQPSTPADAGESGDHERAPSLAP